MSTTDTTYNHVSHQNSSDSIVPLKAWENVESAQLHRRIVLPNDADSKLDFKPSTRKDLVMAALHAAAGASEEELSGDDGDEDESLIVRLFDLELLDCEDRENCTATELREYDDKPTLQDFDDMPTLEEFDDLPTLASFSHGETTSYISCSFESMPSSFESTNGLVGYVELTENSEVEKDYYRDTSKWASSKYQTEWPTASITLQNRRTKRESRWMSGSVLGTPPLFMDHRRDDVSHLDSEDSSQLRRDKTWIVDNKFRQMNPQLQPFPTLESICHDRWASDLEIDQGRQERKDFSCLAALANQLKQP